MTGTSPNKGKPPTKRQTKAAQDAALVDLLEELEWVTFEIVQHDALPHVRCGDCGELLPIAAHGEIRDHADYHRGIGSALRPGETISVHVPPTEEGRQAVKREFVVTDIKGKPAPRGSRLQCSVCGMSFLKEYTTPTDLRDHVCESRNTPSPQNANERVPTGKTVGRRKRTKTVIDEPEHSWDRRKDETDPAWEAFVVFREMGLSRSLRKTAEVLDKHVKTLSPWSKKYTWVLRANAYDTHLDREWQLEMREARRTSARRNARIANRAMELVETHLERLQVLDPGDVARLMSEASKLERQALGIADSTVEVSGKGGGPIETFDATLLTDEERHTRLLALKREIEQRTKPREDDPATA